MGTIAWEGEDIGLVVVYPDAFPYLRPEVYAPALTLPRHQNPFRGNLCLLERSSRAWDVDGSGTWLITERVPYLLGLLKEGHEDELRQAEAPQGEPMSRYFRPIGGSDVFIPEAMLNIAPEIPGGTVHLAVGQGEEATPRLRACLSRVQGPGRVKGKRIMVGPTVAEADEALRRRFGRTALTGTWVRLDQYPLSGGEPQDLLDAARDASGYQEPEWQKVTDGRLKVVGVVAKEEVQQGVFEDAWLFVLRLSTKGGEKLGIARGERLSVTDLSARIPSLRGLQEKTVALTGLGTLGGPMACELARTLVGELRVLDYDDVEVGNTVRWPFGISAAGHHKSAVVGHTLRNDYPYTRVTAFGHQLGSAPPPGEPRGPSEVEVLDQLLSGADLLVEATAELGVQYYLSMLATERGLPQIYAWMTEGGVGGAVARVVPGVTGCWYCLQWHLKDGTIPTPPAEKTGLVQPRGCAEPTFTGSSFDALPIVSQTVRVAARTLLHGRGEGPDVADAFVCAQPLEESGLVSPPSWQSFPLDVHEKCEWCAGAAA